MAEWRVREGRAILGVRGAECEQEKPVHRASFLWLDFRRNTSASGLFHSLAPSYNAHILPHPCDPSPDIDAQRPHFLCFEFDTPLSSDLAVLRRTRLQHPDLPLLMITEGHSESLAIWAFRSGVWDYLVKPLATGDLDTCIASLCRFCLEHRRTGPLTPWPLPSSMFAQSSGSASRVNKTLSAREFVKAHFAETIRLSVVATHCHMSESEFSRFFKKEHGDTFYEYLLKFRIGKACELLADASVQVKSVAFAVGFNDLSYFARTFRRYTGVTPSTYQQACAAHGR
jgi:Response regulator containing CheY-like receiver domain and AraC-type DNA-binding domain